MHYDYLHTVAHLISANTSVVEQSHHEGCPNAAVQGHCLHKTTHNSTEDVTQCWCKSCFPSQAAAKKAARRRQKMARRARQRSNAMAGSDNRGGKQQQDQTRAFRKVRYQIHYMIKLKRSGFSLFFLWFDAWFVICNPLCDMCHFLKTFPGWSRTRNVPLLN